MNYLDKNRELNNIKDKTIFLREEVKKGKCDTLKTRLQTLIKSKGLSEADFYNSLGFSKQYWYLISWGLCRIPIELKVKIANALNIDSSVIWQETENGYE